MTGSMRRNVLLIGAAILVIAALVWAWIDGGAEPVHAIAEPVQLPGDVR